MDPSRTGYFETTPTTMPILSRLDVIERQGPKGQTIVPPATEDLVPSELKYRLSPGDVLRVEIFELVTPGQAEREELSVDQTGNARIKEIGDVAAAGLTIEEFQLEVSAKVGRLIANPVVQVSLLKGQGFQFAITGAVNQTGVYTLERPDFRLSEAIALAGGTLPTTQRVKVIRAAPLDDSLRPVYPKRQATGQDATGGAPAGPTTTVPTTTVPTKPEAGNSGSDIDQLINQLGNDTKAPAAKPADTKPADTKPADTKPADAPKSSPGMIGDVSHAQDAKPVAATATTDAGTPGDTTMSGDATATAGDKGCLSASDMAFVDGLKADAAAAGKFTDDVKNCTLSAASETDQAKATAKIGTCIVGKGYKVSETCGGCYGLRGYCTFKNCVANPTEAATANCIASPGGDTCTACATKYNCISASEDCKAGK